MISIVVCTHNRAGKLHAALQSLGAMVTPSAPDWELLVVDNNCTDHTREVVTGFSRGAPAPTRYLFEGRPGLARARNRGVEAARGDVIAFTDDDCRADPHWLERIDAEFRADPSLAILGGRVELQDPADAPIAVRVHRERVLVRSLEEITRLMIGCNMSARRRLFDEVGPFDVRFGSGARIPAAEDWDFFYRSHTRGAKIVFAPEVLVRHDHGRRPGPEIDAVRSRYAIGRWAFYVKHATALDAAVARAAARELRWLVAEIAGARQSPRALIPVVLGAAYWLGAMLRPGAGRRCRSS